MTKGAELRLSDLGCADLVEDEDRLVEEAVCCEPLSKVISRFKAYKTGFAKL